MKFARWGVAALAVAVSVAAVAEGDAKAGAIKAYTCLGCHGVPGYNNVYPTYRVPKLGGQSADYLVAALRQYRAGERLHATMHAQASSLSDQDMADIAAFLTSAPHHANDKH
jgi:cytochrome c553